MTKRRILIVGEDLAICSGIKVYMETGNADVCCMTSPTEALECFMNQEYCLVIIELHSRGGSELELLHTMRAAKSTPILVLTNYLEADDKIALFQAGASAYMEKPIDVEVCVAQSAALNHLYLDSECDLKEFFPLAFGTDLIISPVYRQVMINNIPIKLTRTEFDLLFCLAKHPGQVWSRSQLYHQVWADDFGSTGDNIVRTHIGNLRKKLAGAGKNYIQNSRGIGYKFVPPAEK